jgi:hypothetical protein
LSKPPSENARKCLPAKTKNGDSSFSRNCI